MDMLARLQDQSSGLQAEAQRGSDMINNFDLEKQMYSGAESAYRLGHEQLSAIVGGEVVQGLHQGISPIYKTGKALVQRAQGLPTSLAEARSRAQQSASEKLSQVSGRPPVQRAADPLPEGGLREDSRVLAPDREERNLRYNVEQGRIETEGGARATIGNERDIKVRTPAEQAEFDSPSVSGRNLPRGGAGPQERVEYPDFGPRTFKAPTQAEHTARLTAERESALPHTAQPDELPDLPGIGSGEPAAASIGTQRVAGEVQPGPQSTYSRGSYRVNPKKSKPSAIEEDAEPDLGPPVEFQNRRLGVTGAETAESQEPIRSGISQRPNPGYRDAPDTSVGDTSVADTTRSPLLQSESTSVEPRVPTQPEAPGAIDDMFPNVPGSDEDLNQRISNLRGPTSVDDSGLPELSDADRATNTVIGDTSNVLKSVAQKEAVVAPEEEIADAIPGVGEIIGGIIGIGAAVAGISEAVSASKDKGPTQPGGTPSMSTAFDSAPVIDSSSYHNL